jgi:hypothetical protein
MDKKKAMVQKTGRKTNTFAVLKGTYMEREQPGKSHCINLHISKA